MESAGTSEAVISPGALGPVSPDHAVGFHLPQGLAAGIHLGLSSRCDPLQGRTDGAGNGRLGGAPGVVGDGANGFDLGLRKGPAPVSPGRSSEVATNGSHTGTLRRKARTVYVRQ